jgi:hypothetical protein
LLFTRRHFQLIPLAIWLLFLSTGAYAVSQLGGAPAAPPEDLAGGYTVTNISYTLSPADPRRIASVAFTIAPSLSTARVAAVRAKLVSASASYSACANVPAGSKRWSCPISGVTIAAADLLTVDVSEAPAAPKYLLRLPLVRR